jgi:hypothetical protein
MQLMETTADILVYAKKLGKGCIQAISVKQTINTKSSAEIELVAVSDGATPVINVQTIILIQGLRCEPPAMIDQDNQSTLAMLDKGRPLDPPADILTSDIFG